MRVRPLVLIGLAGGSRGAALARPVRPGVVVAGLLAVVAVGAQASNLVLDPGRWDELAAWLFGGGAVLCACAAAAWRVGGGSRAGRAWWLWAAAAAFLVAGAVGVAGFQLASGSVPLLAYTPWLGFALLGVAGLAFRCAPGAFAFPLFVLDAFPAMLAAVAFIRTDGGVTGRGTIGWQLLSTVFPAVFMLLALVAVEVVLAGRHRLFEDVSIAAGFSMMALASILWVSPADGGFARGGWSDALWTAGALVVAFGGGRAAVRQEEPPGAGMGVVERESGARALLPVAGAAARVLMLIEEYGRFHLLVWVTLAALVMLAARFFLARRAAGVALERERDARMEIEQARRQLAEQNERLLEVDRLKDSFVAAVSHELRTPLTSIRGYLELVREGEVGELTAEQEEFLAIVDRNADRLLRVIGDLLAIAQADSGRLSLELREVDLWTLVTDAVEAVTPAVEAKGISLRHRAGAVPSLVGDPHRLGQVLDNLLSNAVKFTPAGGVVEVRTSIQGRAALLEVADTGMGMSPGEQARLFERFYRTSAANEQAIPGTGLGLAIVKAIVESHGGQITVESREGQGTTFRVCLPLQQLPVEAVR
ncbi:MAG: sensor histidine kinase [Solirubrobacteraceae bacterium]